MPVTLIGHLAVHAKANPAGLAVAFGTQGITYRELWTASRLTADFLHGEGVKPGDRVMIAAARIPEFLYAYFACHILRAIAVPYDPDIAATRFGPITERLRPHVIMTNRAMPIETPCCTMLAFTAFNHSASLRHADEFIEPIADQPADILLTSGTTGHPKGVTLTHRNILAAARNINQFIGNDAEDREALALPLHHSFGLGRVRCQILAGGAVILTKPFQFPKQMFEAMSHWKATGFSFVPAAWAVLTSLTGERLAQFSDSLRYIEIGSAPMLRREKERLMRLFPRTRICMHYGLTEASRSAFIEFHESRDRLDSIGRPAPNVEIRIADEEGHSLGPNRIGKIQIRGAHVMKGYWDADGSDRLKDTWLCSGDLGYFDQAGYLFVSGREDDQINIGGRKVHPTEIEQALLDHEYIAEALCVGSPDPITGESVRAFVVAKPGHSELPSAEALAHFLRGRLEEYKIPVAFTWLPSLPMNASGKVKRSEVMDLLAAAADRGACR
jgi:long-chain acyl-CoA synthetase